MATPLRLENYFFIESHFISPIEAAPAELAKERGITLQPEAVEANAEAGVNKDDPLSLNCRLTIVSKEGMPFTFKMVVMGIFHVSEEYSERPGSDVVRLILITGASILYSAAREHLLTISGRGVLPPVMLPTVSFGVPNTSNAKISESLAAP